MILLKSTIISEFDAGNICIDPFVIDNVGPNSIDVTLNNTLRVYTPTKSYGKLSLRQKLLRLLAPELFPASSIELDVRKNNPTTALRIPRHGLLLLPGRVYLGATNETASSNKYVPMYDGRSSMGRLGISSHITAGFGDIGFAYADNGTVVTHAKWTLEITVVHPARVYPWMRIGQVFFMTPDHEPTSSELYVGKYSYQQTAQASMSFLDKEWERQG